MNKHKREPKKITKPDQLRVNGETPKVLAKKINIGNKVVAEFKRKKAQEGK